MHLAGVMPVHGYKNAIRENALPRTLDEHGLGLRRDWPERRLTTEEG